jgi:uncharacterized delta-60 repeat protein
MPDVEWASAVAVQDDGRIVIAGASPLGAGYYDFVVLRRNPDGSPDTTFSGDGRATLHIDQYDLATAVAIAPGGEILVAGSTTHTFGGYTDSVLARLRSDGSPDTGFSGHGWLRDDVSGAGLSDAFEDAAVQDDGRIVVAGRGAFTTGWDMTARRYEEDGTPDASFSGDGLQTADLDAFDRANAVAIQPGDGKIVLAGDATPAGSSQSDFALARLEEDGDLDPAFSGDGKARDPRA